MVGPCEQAFSGAGARMAWLAFGLLYIGLACFCLIGFTVAAMEVGQQIPALAFIQIIPIMAVVATDTGAYFTGRRVGGPKIAPASARPRHGPA